jgi:hypothetical protein
MQDPALQHVQGYYSRFISRYYYVYIIAKCYICHIALLNRKVIASLRQEYCQGMDQRTQPVPRRLLWLCKTVPMERILWREEWQKISLEALLHLPILCPTIPPVRVEAVGLTGDLTISKHECPAATGAIFSSQNA